MENQNPNQNQNGKLEWQEEMLLHIRATLIRLPGYSTAFLATTIASWAVKTLFLQMLLISRTSATDIAWTLSIMLLLTASSSGLAWIFYRKIKSQNKKHSATVSSLQNELDSLNQKPKPTRNEHGFKIIHPLNTPLIIP